jgi:hypothetical protein
LIDTFLGAPTVDDWRTYSPVLRAKASEWQALKQLTPGVRQRIAPIVEFIPDWQTPGANTTGRKRRAPQTPAEYVSRVLDSSVAATPAGTRSFIYFGLAQPSAIWSGVDLWREYATRVPASTRVIPLADLSSLASAAALPNIARTRCELGLRLGVGDVSAQLASRIAAALRATGLGPETVHIVVDLKDAPVATSHGQIRTMLRNANQYASVVVLAGVFPTDLTQYQPGVASEPRTEWTTWWREHVTTPANERLLAFGDYTTQCARYHPSPEVPGSVSLRYTIDDAVLVFRGRQSNNGTGLGHDQMHGHCRLLVARPDYDGAAFSWGDQRIGCWTDPANGTGNAVQWRTASVVHHITHVVAQLQDQVGSSASARTWARVQASKPCS